MANRTFEAEKYYSEYYRKNRERLLRAKRQWWEKWYPEHKGQLLAEIKEKRWRLKREVLTHYGNSNCTCVMCGFGDIRALSLDHILGGGNALRREGRNPGGSSLYRYLRKRNYPEGYQTLCMNCQMIKKIENKELPAYQK